MQKINLLPATFLLLGLLFFVGAIIRSNSLVLKPSITGLLLNVDEALPKGDFSIWIPTGDLKTSSLIKVPRYPRKIGEHEIIRNNALKNFQINAYLPEKIYKLNAVRNEQVSFQIVLGGRKTFKNIKIALTPFVSENESVLDFAKTQIRAVAYHEVEKARSEYVWSAKMEDVIGEGTSGNANPNVVADALLPSKRFTIAPFETQAVWITLHTDAQGLSGQFQGGLVVESDEIGRHEIKIEINVFDTVLPHPENFIFNVDLWINPSAIAEVYKIPHWSEKHWTLIESYLRDYASRGGKNITAVIVNEPWRKKWLNNTTRSQTAFGYQSMVKWIKNSNGWEFDFSVFERYISLAKSVGLRGAINVFSIMPFRTAQTIEYWDTETQSQNKVTLHVADKLYEIVWTQFLKAFKDFLIQKNWLSQVYLGFDEQPEELMQIVEHIIAKTSPDFLDRIFIAGHPDNSLLAENLSISYMYFPGQLLEGRPETPTLQTIAERNKSKKGTSFYLCAEPAHPNTLIYSPAIEARIIPWLCLKYNTTGYLRWAYNSWTSLDPINKGVFIHNQGDDFYVYPGKKGPVSSIRWELLKEGIEDYELFKIKQQTMTSEEQSRVIDLATRNQDGRLKNVADFLEVEKLLYR